MRKAADINAEIEKVENNAFLPAAVKKIKLDKLKAELAKASSAAADPAAPKKAAKVAAAAQPAAKGESVYIEYLDKKNKFQPAKKYFASYELAEKWGKKEFESFNPDMIHYGEKPKERSLMSKPKKAKTVKKSAAKKPSTVYKYKNKTIKQLTEEDCNELRKDVAERRKKQAKSEKKSKSKPVIEKIASNVATAVKQTVKSVSAADIKDNPGKEINKMKLIAIEAKKFVAKVKAILGDEYDATAVKDEFKEVDALIKDLEKKYV